MRRRNRRRSRRVGIGAEGGELQQCAFVRIVLLLFLHVLSSLANAVLFGVRTSLVGEPGPPDPNVRKSGRKRWSTRGDDED